MTSRRKVSGALLAGFSATVAAKLAGLSYDTVDYWATSGFLKPSIAQAEGTGTKRLYSFADVLALKVASGLRKQGISLQGLRRVANHLRARRTPREQGQPLLSTFLVSDGEDVYEVTEQELVSLLRRPGQGVFHFVVDLGRTIQELEADVQRLAA